MFLPDVRAFGSQATSLPLHRLQELITPAICSALQSQGYAIIDNIFGNEIALQLREEVKSLRSYMHSNCTHVVRPGNQRSLVAKKDIYEAELIQPETQALAPMCSILQHDGTLRKSLSAATAPRQLTHQAVKLQWNAGDGGCFPMHFDTDASVDNRVVTAIWYQNPDWKPEHGGELRLYPFPQSPSVTISPVLDRMVLFSSSKMVHRVLPSFHSDRYCFTIWLSSDASSPSLTPEKVQEQRSLVRTALSGEETQLSEEKASKLLEIEELRRHAIKFVYRKEWEKSLLQSHPEGRDRDDLVGRMKFEVDVIGKALRPLLPVLEKWSSESESGSNNNNNLDCKIDWM